jgi:hypothetical protein
MKVDYLPRALKALDEAPPAVRRAEHVRTEYHPLPIGREADVGLQPVLRMVQSRSTLCHGPSWQNISSAGPLMAVKVGSLQGYQTVATGYSHTVSSLLTRTQPSLAACATSTRSNGSLWIIGSRPTWYT